MSAIYPSLSLRAPLQAYSVSLCRSHFPYLFLSFGLLLTVTLCISSVISSLRLSFPLNNHDFSVYVQTGKIIFIYTWLNAKQRVCALDLYLQSLVFENGFIMFFLLWLENNGILIASMSGIFNLIHANGPLVGRELILKPSLLFL